MLNTVYYFILKAQLLWAVSIFLYTSFSVHLSQRLRGTQRQMRLLMNLLTHFSSAGFSALLNARLYDSVFIYTVLVTNILTIIFLDHAKL